MLERLFERARERSLDAGHVLFHAGDPVSDLALVREGEMVLERQSASGRATILQRARAGQVLAEASAYAAAYHCDGRAVVRSRVASIPVAVFRARLAEDPELGALWAAHLSQGVQAARLRAEIRGLRTVDERLDAWLGAAGELPPRGAWQALAAELGVTPEALYRALARRRVNAPSAPGRAPP